MFLYKTTLSLLSHLGITRIEELPEYGQVKKEIEEHYHTLEEEEKEKNTENAEI